MLWGKKVLSWDSFGKYIFMIFGIGIIFDKTILPKIKFCQKIFWEKIVGGGKFGIFFLAKIINA